MLGKCWIIFRNIKRTDWDAWNYFLVLELLELFRESIYKIIDFSKPMIGWYSDSTNHE
jgi:hypothetical protein